jgi:hypothetical protein
MKPTFLQISGKFVDVTKTIFRKKQRIMAGDYSLHDNDGDLDYLVGNGFEF